jgi:hypothetical protein
MASLLTCGRGASMGRNPSRDPHIQGKETSICFSLSFLFLRGQARLYNPKNPIIFIQATTWSSLEMVQIMMHATSLLKVSFAFFDGPLFAW